MYVNFKPSKAGDFDKVELKADDAKKVFHAVNRMLSLVDTIAHNPGLCVADEGAYNLLSDLVAGLHRELKPGQERS